jgi:hypothetical protein
VGFLEKKLAEYGVIDITKNSWTFERWETSTDPANWSLVSDDEVVRVPFFGAYSGSTGTEGITTELVYYDHKNPLGSSKDKIVVIPSLPRPTHHSIMITLRNIPSTSTSHQQQGLP